MRLLTWNVRRGSYARKALLLEQFSADVAVIPEISCPDFQSHQVVWVGKNPKQGMAVIAREPYQLRRLPEIPNTPKFIIPIEVSGPRSFVLLAVWTLGEKAAPYVEAAVKALDMYSPIFESLPVVMMGDFNSNAMWDKQHPSHLNHSALVKKLNALGITSAYHHNRSVNHGEEPKSECTFYLYGHENRAYHIDYCFIPTIWADQIDCVSIGNYSDWREHSDHRPLIVSLRDV